MIEPKYMLVGIMVFVPPLMLYMGIMLFWAHRRIDELERTIAAVDAAIDAGGRSFTTMSMPPNVDMSSEELEHVRSEIFKGLGVPAPLMKGKGDGLDRKGP